MLNKFKRPTKPSYIKIKKQPTNLNFIKMYKYNLKKFKKSKILAILKCIIRIKIKLKNQKN